MFTFKLFTPNIYLNFVHICLEIIFGYPWACTIKLFLRPQFMDFCNKQEYLSLASLSSLV